MSAARTCHSLGVCQARTPACPGCTCHADIEAAQALAASAQASRNTGCCAVLADTDYDLRESLSPMERIAYWGGVGAVVGLGIVAVFGTAGYLSVKALGL